MTPSSNWEFLRAVSEGISNCPPFSPGSILDTFQTGRVIFQCLICLPFYTVHGIYTCSWQEHWSGLPFPPPVDHILSELSTVTRWSWVALHGMAHSFIESRKPLHHDKAVIHEGEEGSTEDEMVGYHHRLNGHELGHTLGESEGQGGLACCLGSQRVGHNLVTKQQQHSVSPGGNVMPLQQTRFPQRVLDLLQQIGESSRLGSHFHQITEALQRVLWPSCQMGSSESCVPLIVLEPSFQGCALQSFRLEEQ